MKLNIKVPHEQRKNLRLALGEGRSGKLLKWYWCKQRCTGCCLKGVDTDRRVRISDLEKKECNYHNLKAPIYSVKVESNEAGELLFI